MITLTFYADSPFANRRIGDKGLLSYTSDQIERMQQENPKGHLLDERIAATTEVFESFKQSVSANLTAIAFRKAAKLTKQKFRNGKMNDQLERFHSWALTAKGQKPEAVSRVFPKGRYVIQRTADDTVIPNLRSVAKGLRKLGKSIPPDVATEADALLAEWTEIYEESKETAAAAQKALADKRESRKALAWELYLNILEIARLFPNDKRAIERYSQQALLGFTKPRG